MSRNPNTDRDHSMGEEPPPTHRSNRGGQPPQPLPTPGPTDWRFFRELHVIVHGRAACTTCASYLEHVEEATMTNESSYLAAHSARSTLMFKGERHLRQINFDMRKDLEQTLKEGDDLRRRIDQLEEELTRERARSTMPASAMRLTPYSHPPVTTTRQRVGMACVVRMEERPSYAQVVREQPAPSASTVTPPVAMATEPVASGSAPIPQMPAPEPRLGSRVTGDISLLDDDSGDEIGDDFELNEAYNSQADVVHSPFGAAWNNVVSFNRPITEDIVMSGQLPEPQTVAQYVFLTNIMELRCNSNLAHWLGYFKGRAQRTPKQDRTPAMTRIVQGWRKPDWLKVFVKDNTGKLVPTTAGQHQGNSKPTSESEQHRIALGLGLPATEETFRRLGNPTSPRKNAHPEVWQSYLLHYAGNSSSTWGLLRQPGQRVDDRRLRSMLRLKLLTTHQGSPDFPDVRGLTARVKIFQLLATPNGYKFIIQSTGTKIQPQPMFVPYHWKHHVVTDDAVAKYLASNGYTLREAVDAHSFAWQWLQDAAANPNALRVPPTIRTAIELAAASVQGYAPSVGGGLPEPIPMEWVPRMNRWWPTALVNAMANASQATQVASGPSAMTVESSGAARPETISTTAPGGDQLSPSVGSLQIQDRDDDMSSQPPPYTGEAGDADMTS